MADYEEGIRRGRKEMLEWLKKQTKPNKSLPVPRKFRRHSKRNRKF